jgi:hypothetical protein
MSEVPQIIRKFLDDSLTNSTEGANSNQNFRGGGTLK